jgi:glycosyltransferase involved in cell wall biosynthesis
MSKKKLLVTATDLMIIQFLIPHINYLVMNGYEVSVACSVVGDRLEDIKKAVNPDVKIQTVRLVRKPLRVSNLKGYMDLKALINKEHYDLIWTNEPVMGVMTRFAARKARQVGTKVLYIAHGFHFYKGAPKLNWLACPIEIFMSRFNDVIVTINWEDYHWAKKHLHTKEIKHIDGIGVDFSKRALLMPREEKRSELGLSKDDILVLSVGELQKRKNHEPMIRAVAALNNPKVKYYICGRGELNEYLHNLVKELGAEKQIEFLGYRRDIPDLMNAADIYAHPSLREGLGLASLEAMAAGLPLVTSNVQGIPDYVENGVTGFMCDPMDVESYKKNLKRLISDAALREKIGKENIVRVRKYNVIQIEKALYTIFSETLGD